MLDTFTFNVLQEKLICIQCVETKNATYMSPKQAHEDVTINSKLFLGMSLLGANTLQNGLVITSTPQESKYVIETLSVKVKYKHISTTGK